MCKPPKGAKLNIFIYVKKKVPTGSAALQALREKIREKGWQGPLKKLSWVGAFAHEQEFSGHKRSLHYKMMASSDYDKPLNI